MRLHSLFRNWLVRSFAVVMSWALASCVYAEDLQLTLPPVLFAVEGLETSVYFDNVVLTQTPEKYRYHIGSGLGTHDPRRWTFTPSASHVGLHRLQVQVRDGSEHVVAEAAVNISVAPANAGAGRMLRLLIVGDSLTHATIYPNALAQLLSRPENPTWTMLGTHRPPQAEMGVAHEGYGGWTWQRFASYFGNPPAPAGRPAKSPFVFAGTDGQPVLDVARYFEESCNGQRPDVVFFLLGVNDCFSANSENAAAIDERIDAMLASADQLLDSFRKAAPICDLAICLTTPPNAREEAFVANYKGQYHRWGWKRIQHRLVQRELEHFVGRETERLFVVPTETMLDPVDGYPENNAVHPSAAGYRQIGASLYAWLKWRLNKPQ